MPSQLGAFYFKRVDKHGNLLKWFGLNRVFDDSNAADDEFPNNVVKHQLVRGSPHLVQSVYSLFGDTRMRGPQRL